MRAVRISLVLFSLMIAVIVGSMIMNRYVSGTMRTMVEGLPPTPDEQSLSSIEELTAFWGKWQRWMRPTMNQPLWRSVNDLVGDIRAYGALLEQGTPEYVGARERLLSAIEEMSRPERAALENLF